MTSKSAQRTIRRASGVTLIELLIVMALIALIAAIAAPAIGRGLDSMALRSTGTRVVAAFRAAQARARTTQRSLAARVESGRITLIAEGAEPARWELESDVRMGDGGSVATYLFLPTGQIVGPERLSLETPYGRRGVLTVGPAPGTVQFVTEGLAGEDP